MSVTSIQTKHLTDLVQLPKYAAFLLQHKLREFAQCELELSKEHQLPLLDQLNHLPEEKITELSEVSAKEFLNNLANNQAKEHISQSRERWLSNHVPIIDKNAITAKDISLVNFIRKQSFLQFIPDYCRDVEQIIQLVTEIDLFCVHAEIDATDTYIDILKDNAEKDGRIIQKINETIPGAVYVFDPVNFKGIYSNDKLKDIIGYSQEELNDHGHVLSKLIHEDDQQVIRENMQKLLQAKDKEIISYAYRIRKKSGEISWLRNYESVFKRNEKGEVIQTIGITLDINKEVATNQALQENELLYKRAEAITHLGNYSWDIKTNKLKWSDELYRIYGLDPLHDSINFDKIKSFNYPEDTPLVEEAYKKAIAEKRNFDFIYRIISNRQEHKILHARGEFVHGKNSEHDMILGTVLDVTEKQMLIEKLKKSDAIYKQAEELANIGNWSWDIKNNRLEWTDQLYRIYGLMPQSEEITMERFLSFIDPDDKERIAKGIEEIRVKDLLDYTFHITSAKGDKKILRSIAHVERNEMGEAIFVVGTERDITEKQMLIDRLRMSEKLFNQAQALTHAGNWSWDIQNNKIEWSDELFRIFGLEPRDTGMSFDEYILLIHPDDREKVNSLVELAQRNGKPWNFTHRLIRPNGEQRTVFATGEFLQNPERKTVMMIGTAQDVTERQALIDRLQESEKLFKQAQSLSHLGNWTLDIKTKTFTWSDEMYNIYELSKGQTFSLDDWVETIHPDDRTEVLEYYEECLKNKKLYDKSHRIVLKNGKEKIIYRKGEFLIDEKGEAIKMIGTTQDVTKEFKVQQELKENQTFIRKITDATPSIIASYNINTGNYVFISEGIEKLLGYPISEVMTKGIDFFVNIIHPDDLSMVMAKNAKFLLDANDDASKNDMVAEITYRMKRKDGEYRWFHSYETIFDRNQIGRVEHVLNISLDITEQVNATEKIKEQEHFIQQIADASPTILYLFDVTRQSMEYINREIFFVLGYTPEEILSYGDLVTSELYHPEDYELLPCRKQSRKSFQQSGSMIQYEVRIRNKHREWKWFLVREIVFKTDEAGQITQILGAALDITHRKEMEKTILQNSTLLEQSNASLEEFAYVASHDLKEPLRKISTFGDRLLTTQSDKMSPDGKVYLNKIIDASQRMQTMITDLLSVSMITGNTSFEVYSLQKILEETLQTLEFKLEQQNAVIKADPLPEAYIIPSQFRQLFQNLLSNSLKFVRPEVQPVITIEYTLTPHEKIAHYQLRKTNNYHCLVFRDNGIGFDNEYSGKIFAIFQRLFGRSEYEGSGIGLAICKKIVEHHGGIIYAEGKEGEGAAFTIILPAT